MRGLVFLVFTSAAFAFSHVEVLGATLALAAGAALVWVYRHYARHH